MPVGKFRVLDVATLAVAKGEIALASDPFKVCLCTSTQTLTRAWAGSSGLGLYSDLTSELAVVGYLQGGLPVTLGTALTSGVVNVGVSDLQWNSLSATVKFAVVYSTANDKPILGFVDLDTASPTGVVSDASDLKLTWPLGAFELTQVA